MISQLKPVFKTLRNAEYVSNDYLYIQNQVQLITHTKKEAMVMKSKKTLYHAKDIYFSNVKIVQICVSVSTIILLHMKYQDLVPSSFLDKQNICSQNCALTTNLRRNFNTFIRMRIKIAIIQICNSKLSKKL